MGHILTAVTLLGLLCGQSASPPPATQPAEAPARVTVQDMLRGSVDPYVPGAERLRFLRAAGVDNELTNEEFTADRTHAEPFARKFDTWPALSKFDENDNGTIDWFEAEAWRLDVRARVMAAFDADKDGRLTGQERDKANLALLAGNLPGGVAGPAVAAPARLAAERMQDFLHRFDEDGDGRLSSEEFDAWREARREEFEARRLEMELQHFDADGDGQLSEEETADLEAFQGRLAKVGEQMRERFLDEDGDGEVTDEERGRAMRRLPRMVLRIRDEMRKLTDMDGDGEVTREERAVFRESMREGMQRRIQGYATDYDADTNGRLDESEREALIVGVQRELDDRMQAYDVNEDGRLDVEEAVGMAVDFAAEIAYPTEARTSPDEGP